MSKPDLVLHAHVRSSLQESADFFRQNKEDEAYRVIDDKLGNLYRVEKITTDQLNAVYRTIVHDPLLNPQTPFSKRQYVPVVALKGKAIRELVEFYSEDQEAFRELVKMHYFSNGKSEESDPKDQDPKALKDGPVIRALLQAAEVYENGNELEGRNRLLEILAHPTEYHLHEEVVKELAQIVKDDFREPQSLFLKRHVAQNPLVDPNRLRAKALELLSMYFFNEDIVQGVQPLPAPRQLPERLLLATTLEFSNAEDFALIAKTSKGSIRDLQISLKYRRTVLLAEVRKWQRMGLATDLGALPALRTVKGMLQTKEDVSCLQSLLHPNLEALVLDTKDFPMQDPSSLDSIVENIGRKCPNLLKLTLRNFPRSIDILLLVQGCPKLEVLDLNNVYLTNFSFKQLAGKCSGLTHIDMTIRDPSEMQTFIESCKDLSYVAFRFSRGTLFHGASFDAQQELSLRQGFAALANCPKLSHLELVNCWLNDDDMENPLSVFKTCKAPLKTLVLDNIRMKSLFGGAKYAPLAIGGPGLETVKISEDDISTTFDHLTPFSQHCPNITTLEHVQPRQYSITQSDSGLDAILQKCLRLNNLSLNPDSLKGLYQMLAKSNCQIVQLDMPLMQDGTSHFDLTGPSADDLIAFVRKNPWLTRLHLRNHRCVNDDVLSTISMMLPNLVSVDLSQTNATHIGIAALGTICPKLKILKVRNLKYLKGSSDGSGDLLLKAISDNFPMLVHLDISENVGPGKKSSFTRDGFTRLGKGCAFLQELDVSWNELRDPEVNVLGNSFPNLRVINNSSNACWPKIYRETMRKNYPVVEVINNCYNRSFIESLV